MLEGRKVVVAKTMDKKMARKVVQQFKNRPNMSIRDVAKKCNVSVGVVQKNHETCWVTCLPTCYLYGYGVVLHQCRT